MERNDHGTTTGQSVFLSFCTHHEWDEYASQLHAELSCLNEVIARLTTERDKYHEAWLAAEGKHSEEQMRAEKAEAERDTLLLERAAIAADAPSAGDKE